MDKVIFYINGHKYEDIKEAPTSTHIDALAGSFEIIINRQTFRERPIFADDRIIIKISNEPYITGYVTEVDKTYSSNSNDISIIGYDATIDIFEGSITNNSTYNLIPFNLMCEKVLHENDMLHDVITINKNKGDYYVFPENMLINAEPSETVFSFLNRFAVIAGCLLTTDGKGALVVYTNNGIDVGAKISVEDDGENDLVKNINFNINHSNRFKKIIVKSQGESLDDKGDDIEGVAFDNNVRRNRVKLIIAESSLDIEGCTKLAEWEVNKRRSDSVQYSCTVRGFRVSDIFQAPLWSAGFLVDVKDDFSGINCKMLVKSVSFSYSESGTTTDLILVSSDSYTLQTQAKKRSIGVQ